MCRCMCRRGRRVGEALPAWRGKGRRSLTRLAVEGGVVLVVMVWWSLGRLTGAVHCEVVVRGETPANNRPTSTARLKAWRVMLQRSGERLLM